MKFSPAAAQPKAQQASKDARIASACRPTGRPRPDWMGKPELLVKAPPGRARAA